MSSRLKKPEFSREHRLGLVVYGGISLAIYMNGICQEFYNAVRGRGIYKLIKALTDADIVVDIISGTSAGGINGVLLSYALANSQGEEQIKFEDFAKVWKNSGDIQELLFQKEHDGVEKASFFNGVGYYKPEIEKALRKRWEQKEKASDNEWFSEVTELDLFVTGTDLLGRIYQVFDNTGCVIDVKDHHATFHLKYREQGDNPFKPDAKGNTFEALAKLCQITSCFPIAFPPVTVSLDDTKIKADAKLVEWGGLKKNRILPEAKPKEDKSRSPDKRLKEIDDDPGEGYRLHFVDGGVLDNRPFSYTIKAIYHRTAERPIFRKLFYIDPSPDRFNNNPKYKEMLKPGVVQVVWDSLIGMPRYESINNDLELIKEHNEKVRRYNFLLVDLEELLDKETPDKENQDFYDQQRNVYLRTRLISLEDKLLPLIFLESEDFVKATLHGECRTRKLDKVAELLAKPFTDPQGNTQRLELLKRLEKEICDLDVDYALRKYFFITEYVYRLLDEDYLCEWLKNKKNIDQSFISETILDALKSLIQTLNKQRKIIEIIKENLDKLFISEGIEIYFFRLLDEFPNEKFPEKFYKAMLWLHGKFLNVELPLYKIEVLYNNLENNFHQFKEPKNKLAQFFEESSHDQIHILNNLSKQSILKKLLRETEKELSKSLSERVKSCDSFQDIEDYNFIKEKLLKYFCQFEKLDTVLYPLDYLAGIPEKQIIETYRISPEDAKLGFSKNIEDDQRVAYKLAGERLRAFGGFLKKSWRANDILWGRLDGLNRIIEALITEDKIKNFLNFLKRQDEPEYLDHLLDEALSLNCLEMQCKQVDLEYLKKHKIKLKAQLEQLSQILENEDSSDKSLKELLIQELVESLVLVGHLVILDQEFNNTMQVSIEEQLAWQQQKQPAKKSDTPKKDTRQVSLKEQKSETPRFTPIKGSFNSTITALAVIELAQQSLDSIPLKEKVEFFCEDYKVGSENLEDIPRAELKKITLRFVRIFRDIIRTWRHKSSFIRSTFWNRLGFAIMGYILILVLEIIVRRFF